MKAVLVLVISLLAVSALADDCTTNIAKTLGAKFNVAETSVQNEIASLCKSNSSDTFQLCVSESVGQIFVNKSTATSDELVEALQKAGMNCQSWDSMHFTH